MFTHLEVFKIFLYLNLVSVVLLKKESRKKKQADTDDEGVAWFFCFCSFQSSRF